MCVCLAWRWLAPHSCVWWQQSRGLSLLSRAAKNQLALVTSSGRQPAADTGLQDFVEVSVSLMRCLCCGSRNNNNTTGANIVDPCASVKLFCPRVACSWSTLATLTCTFSASHLPTSWRTPQPRQQAGVMARKMASPSRIDCVCQGQPTFST